MTTLAIIGAGIAGRTLLYSLAKSDLSFKRVLLFSTEVFAPACSFHSTAVVAARGVTRGLSPLGDVLFDSFQQFEAHFHQDHPAGVQCVPQLSGASQKLEQFRSRYSESFSASEIGGIRLTSEYVLAQEKGYLIDPETYLKWMLDQSLSLPLEIHSDFVTEVIPGEKIKLLTQSGHKWDVDKLVFCGGAYNRHWKELFSGQKISSSKPVHGSFLEYKELSLPLNSLSLTLDGDNFIYDKERGRLLIGSTTEDHGLYLGHKQKLREIYHRLVQKLELKLPTYAEGQVRTGIREKASKREPYLCQQGNLWAIGGLYKNGYSAGLLLSQRLAQSLKED